MSKEKDFSYKVASASSSKSTLSPKHVLVKMVTLESNDGCKFVITQDVAYQSKTIKCMFETLDSDKNPVIEDDGSPIPLPNISSATLLKVIKWCEHHKNDQLLKEDGDDLHDIVSHNKELPPWDAQFLDLDLEELYDLISAANYLDIQRLLDYCCLTIAIALKNKTPAQIRTYFKVTDKVTKK